MSINFKRHLHIEEGVEMRLCLILSLLTTMAAFLLAAVAIGLPYWQYAGSPDEKYQGLWTACNQRRGECKLIRVPPEALDAVRVMMCFGMCFYLIATLLAFLYLTVKREKPGLVTGALFLTTIGGICCMVGVIVYGAKYNYLLDSQGTSLHAGFGVAVVATILGFVCTLMYCMAKARDEVD